MRFARSLFNLFIVSHILHICNEYICVLYNRVCSFKHSPRSELCLGARAWTVLSLLACKLLCLRAMTVRLRNSGVIVVCGGDFSTFQQGILTLFWEERGVVFSQRQTGCSFLYVVVNLHIHTAVGKHFCWCDTQLNSETATRERMRRALYAQMDVSLIEWRQIRIKTCNPCADTAFLVVK